MENARPWISLVHVLPASGSDTLGPEQRGAFANIVAMASDETDYKEKVHKELESVGLLAAEFDDLQTAEAYAAENRITPELNRLIDALDAEFPVQYHSFFTYRDHDG